MIADSMPCRATLMNRDHLALIEPLKQIATSLGVLVKAK